MNTAVVHQALKPGLSKRTRPAAVQFGLQVYAEPVLNAAISEACTSQNKKQRTVVHLGLQL